jgi:hypothetical protein
MFYDVCSSIRDRRAYTDGTDSSVPVLKPVRRMYALSVPLLQAFILFVYMKNYNEQLY